MRKVLISMAAAGASLAGAAFAEDCRLDASAPEMPNPKEATADDRDATIAAIKDYQAALGEYRACLDAISGNEELDVAVRQQAIKDFNASVEDETKMVEAWQKFDKKYQKANS